MFDGGTQRDLRQMIPLSDITAAYNRLKDIVVRTPFAQAPLLSKRAGAEVWLKKENLQLTGAYKLRGAYKRGSAAHLPIRRDLRVDL
jgi:threonine dehydratase